MELVVEKQAFLWYSFVNTVLNGHFWKLNGFRDWKCPHKIILLYANDLNPVQSCLLWNPLLCRDWIEPIYSEFKVSFQFASSSELALIEPLACFSHPKGTRPKWITQVVVLSFILEYFCFSLRGRNWSRQWDALKKLHSWKPALPQPEFAHGQIYGYTAQGHWYFTQLCRWEYLQLRKVGDGVKVQSLPVE